MVNIVIAEDHEILRHILRTLLDSEQDLKVIGEAEDGASALRLVDELHPDILLADISMPAPDGIALTRSVCRNWSRTNVLILSLHRDGSSVREAMEAGAKGYVPKQNADVELIDAIRSVTLGQTHYPAIH